MITAKMVQELREKTGAGMMDCKKALDAANGDMTLAIENLRKTGAAKAEKKSGRSTNQGKVWTKIDGKEAAIVEVLCETDFAANTDKFAKLVGLLADGAIKVAKEGDIAAEVNKQEEATLHEYPTQGWDQGLPHCRRILYQLSHQGSRKILEWVASPFSSGPSQPRN